jgi:hypothetical protein
VPIKLLSRFLESAGMVSSRAGADFKQLIQDVEQDLATGRACQAFVRENGVEP